MSFCLFVLLSLRTNGLQKRMKIGGGTKPLKWHMWDDPSQGIGNIGPNDISGLRERLIYIFI